MNPYWTSSCGRWTVYNGDCLAILPTLEAGSVDCILADPPYGIEAVKRGKCFGTSNACKVNTYAPIMGDDQPFDPTHLLDLAPTVCLWGANHYSHMLPKAACWLVWDKRDGCNPNPLADCELAWVNRDAPARLFHHRWMGMIRASERGPRLHPTQKPAALMQWALDTLGVAQDAIVCDPYMGSGPVAEACVLTNRRFIGIEIDERYCEIAVKRIEKEAAHLFAEVAP